MVKRPYPWPSTGRDQLSDGHCTELSTDQCLTRETPCSESCNWASNAGSNDPTAMRMRQTPVIHRAAVLGGSHILEDTAILRAFDQVARLAAFAFRQIAAIAGDDHRIVRPSAQPVRRQMHRGELRLAALGRGKDHQPVDLACYHAVKRARHQLVKRIGLVRAECVLGKVQQAVFGVAASKQLSSG